MYWYGQHNYNVGCSEWRGWLMWWWQKWLVWRYKSICPGLYCSRKVEDVLISLVGKKTCIPHPCSSFKLHGAFYSDTWHRWSISYLSLVKGAHGIHHFFLWVAATVPVLPAVTLCHLIMRFDISVWTISGDNVTILQFHSWLAVHQYSIWASVKHLQTAHSGFRTNRATSCRETMLYLSPLFPSYQTFRFIVSFILWR